MTKNRNTTTRNPEVLKSIARAEDAYEAVALWWSYLILDPKFRSGIKSVEWHMAELSAEHNARQRKPEILIKIGEFAEKLAQITREGEIDTLDVEYSAPPIFAEVADAVGMPYDEHDTFPWKSVSDIDEGVAQGKAGSGLEWEQIWPPKDPA